MPTIYVYKYKYVHNGTENVDLTMFSSLAST